MAVVEASKEVIWMKEFIGELGIWQEEFLHYSDNQSNIHLAKNVAYHPRTKYIHRRFDWLRERVEERYFSLVKVHMEDNGSDLLMKVLPVEKLNAC